MVDASILKKIITGLDLNVSSFEREIEVGASTISKAINRKSKLTMDVATKILDRYPQVNREYLMTGKGNIFIKDSAAQKADPGKKSEPWEGIPVYNAPISPSFVQNLTKKDFLKPEYHLKDYRFKNSSFCALVSGEGMSDEIRSGDQVVCQEISDHRFLMLGAIYYIIATNGLQACRYLFADPENKNNFLLVAKDKNITPSPIPKDMIQKLYKVNAVIKSY